MYLGENKRLVVVVLKCIESTSTQIQGTNIRTSHGQSINIDYFDTRWFLLQKATRINMSTKIGPFIYFFHLQYFPQFFLDTTGCTQAHTRGGHNLMCYRWTPTLENGKNSCLRLRRESCPLYNNITI